MKLSLILALLNVAFAFQPKPTGFDAFKNFVADTQRIPVSLKKNCNWHYAVVKVNSDKNGKVNGYEVLNEAHEDLKKSFSFLVGYKFDERLAVNGRPVVFIYTVYSNQEDCEGPIVTATPTEALVDVFGLLNKQRTKEPNTIFLYDVIIKGIYSRKESIR